MYTNLSNPKTNIPKFQNSNLFTFVMTMSGVAVGVMASLAMAGPMMHSEVSSATKGLSRTINARPASTVATCAVPSGGGVGGAGASAGAGRSANGAVLGTEAAMLPSERGGGDDNNNGPGGGGNTFVTKLVGGLNATNNSTISGNGADSNNKIVNVNKSTTTIRNDNYVKLTNNNEQTAVSGDATASKNTGGDATADSGDATNTSTTTMGVHITN